jgi:glycosyltransferase involved in cell wall biosynthesis
LHGVWRNLGKRAEDYRLDEWQGSNFDAKETPLRKIPEETIQMIAFIQPFGVQGHGGGSRILRALLDTDHPPVLSVNTGFFNFPSPSGAEEIHLPLRARFGRLEHTRFHGYFSAFDGAFQSRFENRLRRVIDEHRVDLIHTIPHNYSIVPVYKVASELNIPYFLSIHDDLEYVVNGDLLKVRMVAALAKAWRNAKGIFAISDEIGREYCRRYGAREYEIVTDGLTCVAEVPRSRPPRSLRVYFMGLFHYAYRVNMRAVLDALRIVRNQFPGWDISVTCRCGSISCPVSADDVPIQMLPFASENEVERDILAADLLYLPLPFEADAANFGRFSLSTKMITYLGSGLPIFYHGPQEAAACKLLAGHHAASICTTLDADIISKQLVEALSKGETIVTSALALARARFMLADQQRRFWRSFVAAL